jgi:hypothetical protein
MSAVTPHRVPSETQARRERAGDDLNDWAVIGLIVGGSSLVMWLLPLLI